MCIWRAQLLSLKSAASKILLAITDPIGGKGRKESDLAELCRLAVLGT